MCENKSTSTSIRVAAAQFTATRDVEANLECISELTRRARLSGAELVVFPEASTYDWQATAEDTARFASKQAPQVASTLSRIAAEQSILLVVGTYAAAGKRVRNRMLAYGRDGERIGTYDKVHLYDSFGVCESNKIEAAIPDGSELSVFDSGPFRVGLFNCYDLRFPEITRALVDAGANTLAIGSAWVKGDHKIDHWQTLLKARAIENTSYVIAACQSGTTSIGESMIVDPFGEIVSRCQTSFGLAIANLDFDHLLAVRKTLPSLAHRRYCVTR